MPRYCAVKVCRNRGGSSAASKQERRISFYPFPLQDNGRLQKWVDNMKRDHEWAPSRHQFLCSEHFTEDCFNIRWGIRYLRNTAIPTIFPSVQDEVETKNQRPRPRACGTDTELSMSHSAPNKRPLILTRKPKATTSTTVGCSTICEDKDAQIEPKGLLELPLASGTNTNHVCLDERLAPEPLSAVHEVHGDSHSSCLNMCQGESLLPQEAADSAVSTVCRELLGPLSDGTEMDLGKSFSFVPVDEEPVKEKPGESVDRVSADRWPGEGEHVSVYEHSYCRADTDREQLWSKILNLHGKILELDHREETAVAKIRALESEIVHLKRDSAVFKEKQNILEDCISSILL